MSRANHQILTPDGERLRIFEKFQVDRNLPKHAAPADDQATEGFGNSEPMMFGGALSASSVRRPRHRASRQSMNTEVGSPISGRQWMLRQMEPGDASHLNDMMERQFELTFWQRFLFGCLRAISPRRQRDGLPTTMDGLLGEWVPEWTVQEFFASSKNSLQELAVLDDGARRVEAYLDRAAEAGQVALKEELEFKLQVVRAELQLKAIDQAAYLEEAMICEFVRKCEKGLRLDWVANFVRHIPDEVLEKKKRCDELCIFDNYVVLHFDPEGKSWLETDAEIERRKDPILFGVLEGSNRLYFVADWIDEVCTLTLDELIATLQDDDAEKQESLPRHVDPLGDLDRRTS